MSGQVHTQGPDGRGKGYEPGEAGDGAAGALAEEGVADEPHSEPRQLGLILRRRGCERATGDGEAEEGVSAFGQRDHRKREKQ